MIRIYLTSEQIDRINEIVDSDIDKNLWEKYDENVLKIVRHENLKQMEDLIGTKEKLKENCKIFGREKLSEFSNKVKAALENDISDDKTRDDIKGKLCENFQTLYESFSKRTCAYEILTIMNVTVCPYCNRMYTFSVKNKTRPEFDHFYSKKEHPWLAISIYNLIPSCGICNKGKSDNNTENLLYPYEESFEEHGIHFRINDIVALLLDEKSTNSDTVKLISEQEESAKIIEKYNTYFKIEDIYDEHKGYILELIKRLYYFNDDCIESIYRSYDEIIDDIDDLRRMSIGNVSKEEYLNTPLAKLTSDIIEQVIYDK